MGFIIIIMSQIQYFTCNKMVLLWDLHVAKLTRVLVSDTSAVVTFGIQHIPMCTLWKHGSLWSNRKMALTVHTVLKYFILVFSALVNYLFCWPLASLSILNFCSNFDCLTKTVSILKEGLTYFKRSNTFKICQYREASFSEAMEEGVT